MDQAAYCPGRRPPIVPLAVFVSLFVASGAVSLLALRATPSTYAWHPFGWFFIVSAFTSVFFVVHWFFEGGWWRVSHWSDDDSALEILRTQAAEEQHERMKKDRGEK